MTAPPLPPELRARVNAKRDQALTAADRLGWELVLHGPALVNCACTDCPMHGRWVSRVSARATSSDSRMRVAAWQLADRRLHLEDRWVTVNADRVWCDLEIPAERPTVERDELPEAEQERLFHVIVEAQYASALHLMSTIEGWFDG